MKRIALIFAAVLASFGTPAGAQTKTGDYVTTTTRLPDADGDGKIYLQSLAKTTTPALPSKTTVYGPCAGSNQYLWRYRVRAACEPAAPVVTPPTEPPVVTPTPDPVVTPPTPTPDPVPDGVVTKRMSDGGWAVQSGRLNLGWTKYAGLGTTINVGKPFLTDAENGFLRLSYFLGTGNDLFLYGRSQDLMNLIVSGRTYSSGQNAGYTQIRGDFPDAFTFNGETVDTLKSNLNPPADGIKVLQQVSIDGIMLDYRVRLTNTRPVAVTVTYFRSEDPDTKADYKTRNKVVSAGKWEAGLTTGPTYVLESPDAGVYAATTPYDKATSIGTRREIGYGATSDVTLQLVWPAKLLQPGESTDIRFRQGLRE